MTQTSTAKLAISLTDGYYGIGTVLVVNTVKGYPLNFKFLFLLILKHLLIFKSFNKRF